MARTKQTARLSTGGCAARRPLAWRSGPMKRQGREATADSGVAPIDYDLDYDRAFYAHFFKMAKVSQRLAPSYSVARIRKQKPKAAAANSDTPAAVATEPPAAPAAKKKRKTGEAQLQAPAAASAAAVAPAGESTPLVAAAGGASSDLVDDFDYYLNVSYNSCYDGDGMARLGRPKLNLVVALDISGSMSSSFTGGEENAQHAGRKSKLAVAVECIIAMMDHLKPDDIFGIIAFNHATHVIHPPARFGSIDVKTLKEDLRALSADGGTDLHKALLAATSQFNAEAAPDASKRIFFLTDLESDGRQFLEVTKANAAKSLWMSIVGIDVSLDSDLIEQVSAVAGANYSNALSEEGFKNVLNSEFDNGVTPTAFDIRTAIEPGSGWTLGRAYGMAELNQMSVGGPAVISSLFPCAHNAKGEGRGGATLFKLVREAPEVAPQAAATSSSKATTKKRKGPASADVAEAATGNMGDQQPPRVRITCSYRDTNGIRSSDTQEVAWVFDTPAVPSAVAPAAAGAAAAASSSASSDAADPVSSSSVFVSPGACFSDSAVRKACLLVQYVDVCTRYLALRCVPDQLQAAHRHLAEFCAHYRSEADALADRSLDAEVQIIDRWLALDAPIAAAATSPVASSPAQSTRSAAAAAAAAVSKPVPTPCSICMDEEQPKNILLLPCRHLCLCDSCAGSQQITVCPLCRGAVKEKIKLFV